MAWTGGAVLVAVLLLAGWASDTSSSIVKASVMRCTQTDTATWAQPGTGSTTTSTTARVAYVGDPRILTAYGADLRNEVRYINIKGGLEERYDDYFWRGHDLSRGLSYDVWKRNLEAWPADYLVAVVA